MSVSVLRNKSGISDYKKLDFAKKVSQGKFEHIP